MSQTFLPISAAVPDGDTGPTLASKLNDWRLTWLSWNSGAARPGYALVGTRWLKTDASPWILYLYDGSADVPIYDINPTTHAISRVYGPEATTAVAGLMAATDKTKLNGVASGATANATDTFLRARGNHSGTQSISTVSGLEADLNSLDARIDGNDGDISDLESGKVPNARTVTAGDGLTGGGDLGSNVTIDLGVPQTVTGSSANGVTGNSHSHALSIGTADVIPSGRGVTGSYAFCKAFGPGNDVAGGATIAGSGLRYTNSSNDTGATPAGTWRNMGDDCVIGEGAVFLRIS